ncbi:MAG: hypothetical protein IH987_17805 [Planctomycetes bacterium]|nr:hypothetical protein [Planctomycetota bacterium]
MKSPNARLVVDELRYEIDVLTKGTLVEVRNYNTPQANGQAKDLWTDDAGRKCGRYFVGPGEKIDIEKLTATELSRFAEDLANHAGIEVGFEPAGHPDGLHVLRIKNADFYFCADGGGYDGWGRYV